MKNYIVYVSGQFKAAVSVGAECEDEADQKATEALINEMDMDLEIFDTDVYEEGLKYE